MHHTTTNGRALAIVAGAAFLVGGLTILLGPVLMTPAQWGQYHVLTILMIGGTIAAGHLTKTAWKARTFLSCIGFLMLFIAGTTLVVYNSVGRQAEVHDTVTMEAEAKNSLIEDKRRDIESARSRLEKAEANADRERGTKCKQRCQDWETAAEDTRHVIRVLESEIKALGAPKPVDAKSAKAGELAGVFGYNRSQASAIAALIEPFLWTIFFEIGSIVSLGFAFRPGNQSVPLPVKKPELKRPVIKIVERVPVPVPPTNGGTRRPRSEFQTKANMIAKEMRDKGEVPKFNVVRSEYKRRHKKDLPKVTAHRAVAFG